MGIDHQNHIFPLAASVDLRNPLLWAVVLGWMLSVVLHELAHGVVGYLGGDYTIRERGGLSLNPLQYIDPVTSIGLPLLFLLMGGIPLVGGVTFIREDLLRSRLWSTAVSLAGPATNFALFLLMVLPFHPSVGWIDPMHSIDRWSSAQLCLAALALLQFVGCIFNLIPIPPLDGFRAIKPYFDRATQELLSGPQVRMVGFAVLYIVMTAFPDVIQSIYALAGKTMDLLGLGNVAGLIGAAFNKVLFNE